MNTSLPSFLRLNSCAAAVLLLIVQAASAETLDAISGVGGSIGDNIASPIFNIGAVNTTSVITLQPNSNNTTASGFAVTFAGDVFVVNQGSTNLVVGSNRARVAGTLSTDGGIFNFKLAPNAAASTPQYASGNFDIKDGSATGKVSANNLVLSGGESFAITLGASLRDGAKFRIIGSDHVITGAGYQYNKSEDGSGQISDNSFVINSSAAVDTESQSLNLVYAASRSSAEYISKSATEGHFSNPAALALGTIAREGRQLGDLVTAINLLDIDHEGFGNNKANLAVQVKRLAPLANNAYVQTALASSDRMLSEVDDRLSSLRGDIPTMNAVQHQTGWANAYINSGKQTGFDDYDGYKVTTSGVGFGFDRSTENGWIGTALSASTSNIEQLDFRMGDQATLSHQQASIFGAREWGAAYLDGTFSMGRYGLSGKRTTAVGRTASAQYDMYAMDLKTTFGYRIKLQDGKTVISPMLGLEVTRLEQPRYTETGAGDLGLTLDAQSYQRVRTTLGVRFNTESRFRNTPTYTSAYMAYNQDTGLDNMDVRASYSGTTDAQYTGFTTKAAALQRSLLELGVGTTLALSKANSLQLRYDLQHRQSYNAQGVQVKGVWKF
jgi:uncharacterized protein with beta-barrel porin domain